MSTGQGKNMGAGNSNNGEDSIAQVGMGGSPEQYGVESREAGAEKVSRANLAKLLVQQEYRCALSGHELTPASVSLDYDTPISRGGLHVMANVQLVTPAINRMKGTMTNEEFIAACSSVVQWRR